MHTYMLYHVSLCITLSCALCVPASCICFVCVCVRTHQSTPCVQALADDLAAQQAALGTHTHPAPPPEALREVVETSLKPYKAMVRQ